MKLVYKFLIVVDDNAFPFLTNKIVVRDTTRISK